MKKVFILIIKYIPIMQMVGILFGNTLVYFGIITWFSHIFNLIFGNSILTSVLLLVASYCLKFCNWHRLMIWSNVATMIMVQYDAIYHLPLDNCQLLLSYYIVYTIFILLAIYSKFKCYDVRTNKAAD